MSARATLDEWDRRLIVATQGGLPLVPQPYHAVAAETGLSVEDVMVRLRRMLEAGIIRRIGVVPNHYALGYRANGMSVWDVAGGNLVRPAWRTEEAVDLAIAPDGGELATARYSGEVLLWPLAAP